MGGDESDQMMAGRNLNRVDEGYVGNNNNNNNIGNNNNVGNNNNNDVGDNSWMGLGNDMLHILKRSDREERQMNGRIRILKKQANYMDGKNQNSQKTRQLQHV